MIRFRNTNKRLINKTRKSRKNRKSRKKIIVVEDDPNKFVKLNCSPNNTDTPHENTCYTHPDLLKLRNTWNTLHPRQPIHSEEPIVIWEHLKSVYTGTCNKESCWVKQMLKGSHLEKELLDSFAPAAPLEWRQNPKEWLSSTDILVVMKQYEKKYKCFDFIGPSPIDYDEKDADSNEQCVWMELCKFNLQEQIQRGKTKIGIIFNTDKHTGEGEHWLSLFINIKKKEIFYFDSAGKKPLRRIKKFMDGVVKQGKELSQPIDFTIDKNYPVRHQNNTYSCGMYSIFFIIHMLEDKLTSHYLKTHKLKDKYVESFRNIYFNSSL
jgi:hypothetical protein